MRAQTDAETIPRVACPAVKLVAALVVMLHRCGVIDAEAYRELRAAVSAVADKTTPR